MTSALEDIIEETLGEMNTIMHMQKEILHVGVNAHDALLHNTEENRQHFNAHVQDASHAVAEALAAPYELIKERLLVQAAAEEWRQVKNIGEKLLARASPGREARNKQTLDRLIAHVDRASTLLYAADDISHGEIAAGEMVALQVRKRMEMLVAGELSHRVSLDTHDEAGRMGQAFNAMAEQIEHSQAALAELSVRDSLTGLYNRREFERHLNEEVDRSTRYKRPLAMLMLNIDHFEVINDTYGHPIGDEVLRDVAAFLSGTVRPVDRVARYGGEEFAVLLPETDAKSAFILATRLCELVQAHSIQLPQNQQVMLTVSIGLATYPCNAQSAEELIFTADQALYTAKSAGRNRVARYTRLTVPAGETTDVTQSVNA